jgi:hypothetical protein
MADKAAPWVRIQALIDRTGLVAALAMAGRPASPASLAEAEVPNLKLAGVRVERDGSGCPCIQVAGPMVSRWLAHLDEWVTGLSAEIEREMMASREPVLSGVDLAVLEASRRG